MPLKALVVAIAMTLFTSAIASQPVVFFGEDSGQGDGAPLPSHPNSDSAFVDFIAVLQDFQIQDFESIAQGTAPPFIVPFGPAIDGTFSGYGRVLAVSSGTYAGVHPISGVNCYLVDNYTSPFSVSFTSPIDAIGFYMTDVGDIHTELTLTLDEDRSLSIPACTGCPSGGVLFFGILSDSQPFSKVTFSPNVSFVDGWGVDDLMIGWVEKPIATDSSSWGTIKSLFR